MVNAKPDFSKLIDCVSDEFKELFKAVFEEACLDIEKITLNKGETLFKQADSADDMYFVLSGGLKVTITQENGKEVEVGKICPGEPIGEICLLAGGKRSANAYAAQNSELILVPRTAFDEFADKFPEAIQKMADIIRYRLQRNQLAASLFNLFCTIDEKVIQDIESRIEWIHLTGNEFLFHQGDPGKSMYTVIRGRLRAVSKDENGKEKVLSEIGQGESLGEIALITGEARSESVYAVRDSDLVMLSKSAFKQIIEKYPHVMVSISQTLINRLRKRSRIQQSLSSGINIAIIPTNSDVPISDFCRRLANALSFQGTTLFLSRKRIDRILEMPDISCAPQSDPMSSRLTAWLDEQERKYKYILYEAENSDTPWTERCIRQADQILQVTQASLIPSSHEIEENLTHNTRHASSVRRTLIFLHPNRERLSSNSAKWLSAYKPDSHHHLCLNSSGDFERLARLLCGRAVGLVLGGGGARGFAHIGVIRALEEAGIPIDLIGGTSIGAIIAAEYAMGWDYETMLRKSREVFIDAKPLRDYTLPLISLISGHKFDRLAEKAFEGACIEDLWVNTFCVSCNLTTSELVIHTSGPVWKAVRASSSLPGIFEPVVEGNNLLVDGGVLNNLPVDVMLSFSAGPVIVASVSPEKDLSVKGKDMPSPWKILAGKILPHKESIDVPSILDILARSTVVGSVYNTNKVKMDVDVYLQPPIDKFGLLEFNSLNKIVEVGYQYTKEKIEKSRMHRFSHPNIGRNQKSEFTKIPRKA